MKNPFFLVLFLKDLGPLETRENLDKRNSKQNLRTEPFLKSLFILQRFEK